MQIVRADFAKSHKQTSANIAHTSTHIHTHTHDKCSGCICQPDIEADLLHTRHNNKETEIIYEKSKKR